MDSCPRDRGYPEIRYNCYFYQKRKHSTMGALSGEMQYLTTGEVARRCQVSLGTVKNWIEAGKLEAFRTPGGHFRIRSSVLKRFQTAFGFPLPEEQPRILVVDDEAQFLEVALETLRDLLPSARVDGAAGGYEALLKIGSFQPHVLLLDLRMPELDGFEVCRRVKAAPETRTTKIVAVTALEDEEAKATALACGADVFVSKLAGLEALGRAVEALLDVQVVVRVPTSLPLVTGRSQQATREMRASGRRRAPNGKRPRAGRR